MTLLPRNWLARHNHLIQLSSQRVSRWSWWGQDGTLSFQTSTLSQMMFNHSNRLFHMLRNKFPPKKHHAYKVLKRKESRRELCKATQWYIKTRRSNHWMEQGLWWLWTINPQQVYQNLLHPRTNIWNHHSSMKNRTMTLGKSNGKTS